MKIKKAEITGFGKWRQETFEFAEGNQLVFGLNEAGKSTLYQFIQAILFGFANKSKKRQDYTPKDGTAYGGSLWLEHPTFGSVKVERYKKQNRGRAKVYLADGTTGDDELLEKILAPLNKKLFQNVFTFQQEQLGQLEALQENELQDLLVSFGISGSEQLFSKRQEYEARAQALYKRKSQKLPLNLLLAEQRQLQIKIQQKEAQEADFQKLLQAEQRTKKELTRIEIENAQLQKSALKVKQQLLNWSNYEEYQHLKQLEKAAVFEETPQLAAFYQKYQQLAANLEELETAFEKHSGMDQKSARYYFYLEHEEKLQELLQQRIAIMRTLDQDAQIDQELLQLNTPLQLGKNYGWGTRAPIPLATAEINQHFQELAEVKNAIGQQETRLTMLTQQQAQLDTEINQLEKNHGKELHGQKNSVMPVISGIVIMVLGGIVSFFVDSPISWIIRIAALGVGGFLIYQQRKGKQSNAKMLWQEKLGKLDVLNGQLASEEKQLQLLQKKVPRQENQFHELLKKRYLPVKNTLTEMLEVNRQALDFINAAKKKQQLLQEKQRNKEKILHYEGEFTFLEDWLPLQQKNVTAKIQALEKFVKEMEQLRFAQSYQQNTLLKQQINETKRKQKELEASYQELMEKSGLQFFSEIPAFLQKQQEIKRAQQKIQELTATLFPLFEGVTTKTAVLTKKQQIETSLKENQQKLRTLQEQQQRFSLQQETLQQDGTLDQLYQAESLLDTQITELAQKWSVAEMTSLVLGDLATELSEQQLPQLLSQAAGYFARLTNNPQAKIKLEEEQILVWQGTWLSLYDLSTGTKNQLVMAVRLAFLAANKPWCPIIIDDGWLHYDHLRKRKLAEILKEFGQNYQIICLSSDKEMVSYYQELQQPIWELKGESS